MLDQRLVGNYIIIMMFFLQYVSEFLRNVYNYKLYVVV